MSHAALVSVGYEGRSVEELVAVLAGNGVQLVVDVRLNAVSRKKGFSKKALAAAVQAAGIGYRHEPALGNPKDNRAAFRRGDAAARARYEQHLHEHGLPPYAEIIEQARGARVALLCFERDHRSCHRSCITDLALTADPGIELVLLP